MTNTEPQKLQRYEAWKRRSGHSWASIGRACGVDRAAPRRWALPKTDPNHRRPEHDAAAALERLSGGEITPASHDDEVTLEFGATTTECSA